MVVLLYMKWMITMITLSYPYKVDAYNIQTSQAGRQFLIFSQIFTSELHLH